MPRGGERSRAARLAKMTDEERAAWAEQARKNTDAVCDGCGRVKTKAALSSLASGTGSRFCYQCRALLARSIRPMTERDDLDTYYRKTYGITFRTYVRMFLSQAGKCAICRAEPGEKNLAVDHCHDTDKVRGLLCDRCNLGLGMFKDDIARLAQATIYLTNHPSDRVKHVEVTWITPADRERKRLQKEARREYFVRMADDEDCLGT